MNVKVEVQNRDAWRRVLAIEVPAADAAEEYKRIVRKLAKRVQLPGFRKGKVPEAMVRKSFRKELDQEFVESVVPKALGQALEETGLDPVTDPEFKDLSFGEDRPLSFTAEFDSRPQIEVKDYKGIAGRKEVREVPEEHVDAILEDFRKSHADLEDVEREVIPGDVLVVDYQAVDDSGRPIPGRNIKGYSFEFGANQVVEAFEKALAKAEPGAVRVAEIDYPEDYPDKILAGRRSTYKIKVRKVQEKRFPELTDALVEKHTDVKTVAELRERVRADLESRSDQAATEQLERVLLDKVLDANEFEPPRSLVDELLEDAAERMRSQAAERGEDPDAVAGAEAKERNRDAAQRQIRRMLILDQIAQQEGIEATAEELNGRVTQLAVLSRDKPQALVKRLGGDRFLRRLSREIRDKKVLAFLAENAEITVEKVPFQPAATE
jgi:trigger factor